MYILFPDNLTVEASSDRILKYICFLLVEGQWHDQ